jgi:hypothetical protein
MTPFEGVNLTEDEVLFNKRMSKARVSLNGRSRTSKILLTHCISAKVSPVENTVRRLVIGELSALEF